MTADLRCLRCGSLVMPDEYERAVDDLRAVVDNIRLTVPREHVTYWQYGLSVLVEIHGYYGARLRWDPTIEEIKLLRPLACHLLIVTIVDMLQEDIRRRRR